MNTLRSLVVDIMFNTGASKLLEVDSAVDSVKSNALEAAGNMDELAESTSSFGDKVRGIGSALSDHWLAITAAGAAAGGALMKATSRATELNEGLRRVALQSDATAEELRNMIVGMTDETSDVDQYVQSLEHLIRTGTKTKEEFEAILPVFDSFGTATGIHMVEGIKNMDAVLSALNIPLSESEEHIDTLTWLVTGTTVSMGDLGRTMRREQARIRELGLTFDEIAVALAALEDEGIKGPRAVMAFQRAIQDAEGDVQAFWEGLGVTVETLERQNELLLESEGLTDAMAAANAESLGIWDKFNHYLDKATWIVGSYLEPVKDLGPLLVGLGPAIKGVSMAFGAFNLALLANPLVWVIGLVAGLGFAVHHLWNTNEEFRDRVTTTWELIRSKAETVFGWLQEFWAEWGDDILYTLSTAWENIKIMTETAINVILELVQFFINVFTGNWSAAWDNLKNIFGLGWEGIKEMFGNVVTWMDDTFDGLATQAIDWGRNIITGIIDGIKSMGNKAKETFTNFANDLAGSFKSFFGIQSPSKLMIEYGADITEGLKIGLEEDVPDIPIPNIPPSDTSQPKQAVQQTVTFNPQIDIHINGNADGQSVRRELEQYFPELMDEFFEMLAVKMG